MHRGKDLNSRQNNEKNLEEEKEEVKEERERGWNPKSEKSISRKNTKGLESGN